MKEEKTFKEVEIYLYKAEQTSGIPFVGDIKAGFPSPSEDFTESAIDLNQYVTKHPSATYFARVNGTSMVPDLNEGDLLVIDRSLDPADGKIAVCFVDGEFTIKRIKIEKERCLLIPSNSDFPVLEVTAENQFLIWGVVSFIIKKV